MKKNPKSDNPKLIIWNSRKYNSINFWILKILKEENSTRTRIIAENALCTLPFFNSTLSYLPFLFRDICLLGHFFKTIYVLQHLQKIRHFVQTKLLLYPKTKFWFINQTKFVFFKPNPVYVHDDFTVTIEVYFLNSTKYLNPVKKTKLQFLDSGSLF